MRTISTKVTDKNFKKIQILKARLQEGSNKTIYFSDALNILLEKSK